MFLVASSLLFSCGDGPDTRALEARIDSLNKEVSYLRDSLRSTNSTPRAAPQPPEPTPTPEEVKSEVLTPDPVTYQDKKIRVKEEKPTPEPKTETLYQDQGSVEYYKSNPKTKSLEITPWKDGRRELRFYGLDGTLQYAQKDVNLSYHVISEVVNRHPNGAIASIKISENPGASLYFYTTTITFNTMNVPEWKTTETYPPTLENSMNNSWYWVPKEQQWKKQEIAIETLKPGR
jgi:hypothetical protein